jgi:hypothetical protein
LGSPFSEQSDSGKETGVITHGEEMGSIFVPLGSVVEDSEVVFQNTKRLSHFVPGQKSLRTDKKTRELVTEE